MPKAASVNDGALQKPPYNANAQGKLVPPEAPCPTHGYTRIRYFRIREQWGCEACMIDAART